MYQEAQVTEGQFIALAKHEEVVADLTRKYEYERSCARTMKANIESAKAIIAALVKDETLDKDEAETLAAALGIDLVRTVVVTVTAEFVVEVEVDMASDNDDISPSDFDLTCDFIGEGKVRDTATSYDIEVEDED